jgi:predicted MFS family arabinose efflux permease
VALVAAAIVAGAAFPPSGSVLRSRWPELLREDPELVRGAYALDSVTIELSFVSGPLITAAIVAALEPQAALGLSAVLVVAGTLLFVMRLPGSHAPAPHGAGRGWGPLRDPAIRLIALTTIPIGFCIGAVEVAVPAFSREIGETALAGVLLALWSVGSGIGGLVFGARQNRRDLLDTFLLMTVVFPLASLPLVAASSPLAMGALVLLAGAPIAPLIATRNELIGTAMPAGTGTEAFTWLITALVAGLALGNAIAGAVIESSGWPEAVLVGVGVGVLGAAGSVAGRRTLRPALAPV